MISELSTIGVDDYHPEDLAERSSTLLSQKQWGARGGGGGDVSDFRTNF